MNYFSKYIVSLLLFMSAQLFAQPEDWDDYINWAWKGSFSPFIEASYGYSIPGHQDITGNFSNVGSADVKFGYGEYKEYSKFVYRLDERYLIGSYFSTELNQIDDEVPGEINTKGWRVGLGTKIGYGYRLGSAVSLIPYNQNQFNLTSLEYTRPQTFSTVDNPILSRMEGASRFGVSTEGGLSFFVAEAISINAAFEGAVVFPRWKILHWLGSFTLQSLSTSLVTLFSESIIIPRKSNGILQYKIN